MTSGPLEFTFDIKPEKEQVIPGIIQCGQSFNVSLKIKSVKSSTFSHRGIDYEFCSEYAPEGARVVKFNDTAIRLSEAGNIESEADFTLPLCTIPEYTQTYYGASFTVKHLLRVWVRKLIGSEYYEQEVVSYNIQPYANRFDPLCVRVAVRGALHVDLLVNRRRFDIDDVIFGAARFSVVDLKLKMLRVQLVAQEMTEVNGVPKKFKNIIDYWEVAYGNPVKNEIVPFRLFLKPINVSPSCANPMRGYSVTHFLHFTVITATGEKYFKALQIVMNKMDRPPFFFIGEDDEFLKEIEKKSVEPQPEGKGKADEDDDLDDE